MTMYVMPNPAKSVDGEPVRVVDPATGQFMPAAGKNVPSTPYWVRRLATGDVIRTTAAEAAAMLAAPAEAAPADLPADASPLVKVIAGLNRDDPAHFTKGGRPNLNVLSELMARRVTADELDAALAEISAAGNASD